MYPSRCICSLVGALTIFLSFVMAVPANAMCDAPFHAPRLTLRESGSTANRISMQSEISRLPKSPTVSRSGIPSSEMLQADSHYERFSTSINSPNSRDRRSPLNAATASQSELMRIALLTAALLNERNFAGARSLLDRMTFPGNPAQWTFENSDRDASDGVALSPEFLRVYLSGARAFARLSSGSQNRAQMWTDLATYVGSSNLLGALKAAQPFVLDALSPETSEKIRTEVTRLASLKRWQLRAELAQVPSLLGFGMNGKGQPAVFGESAGRKFSIGASSGGGGIVIRNNEDCHHDYGGGFFLTVERFEEHRDKFELATVIRSNGQLVMQLRPDFADAAGLQWDHFPLSQNEQSLLNTGTPLPASSNVGKVVSALRASKKALVLWEHPLAQKRGSEVPSGQAEVLHQFASGMNLSYPDLGVYKDPPADDLPERVAALEEARLSETPIRVIVDLSFGVAHAEPAKKVAEKYMDRPGIEVVYYLDDTPAMKRKASSPSLTIVITGHSNQQLAQLVRDLGSKGFLKNNFVVFESCGTALTDDLVAEMLGRYGAKAAYHYANPINPDDAAGLLDNMLQRKFKPGVTPLQSVPTKATKELPEKKAEALIAGAWTICKNINVSGRELAA